MAEAVSQLLLLFILLHVRIREYQLLPMKLFFNRHVVLCLLMLCAAYVNGQQLKLGSNPTVLEKSALLDLNSDKQGLLLPRVNNYGIAPLNTAPDGMLIYYVPEKVLYVRKNGAWRKLVDETIAITSVNGQTGPVVSLTTANITENTNLYYTDARARGAFAAGTGISISGTGVVAALNTSNLWNAAQLQGRNIATTAPADQYVLTWDAATNAWMPKVTGGGSVSSVGLSLPTSVFTVTGSPVTTTGTLTSTFKSQTANTFFAAPATGAGTPSFRALVASDIPAGSNNYIQNISTGTQTASFNISGSGTVGTRLEVGGTVAATGISGLRLTGLGAATLQPSLANTLAVNANGDVVVTSNASANNWLITGNANVDANNQFLGTVDDRKMVIRSNNQSFLEFGRRATLNLIDGYPDYTDGNEKVTLLRSALQFDVPATVQFYKPKFWTTTDGNFRLKGSAAGTDFFELGSTGADNNGGFEFIVGDDGDEPILFKSYYYGDQTTTEVMRMQRKKVGINVNGVEPAQTLDVRGTMRLTGSTGTANSILGRNTTSGDVSTLAIDAATLSITTGTLKANNTTAQWNANQLQGVGVATTAPTNGQYLVYNGTSWTPTTPAGGSPGGTGNWSTTGNSGTTAGTNFIGTTDARALVVKTNNTEAVRVDATGKVGVKTTAPTSTMHVNGSVATGFYSFDDPPSAVTMTLDDTHHTISRRSTTWQNVGTVTLQLPAASSCPGREYVFVNTVPNSGSGSGELVVVPNGSDAIGALNGGASMRLYKNYAVIIQSSGSYWVVINRSSATGESGVNN